MIDGRANRSVPLRYLYIFQSTNLVLKCVGQVGSIPRLGLRSLCMQDSPVGVRDTDYNSVFSSGEFSFSERIFLFGMTGELEHTLPSASGTCAQIHY